MRMRSFLMFLMALVTALGFAKQTASDIPVTTTLADLDATATPYDVQSDGRGAYPNSANSVASILVGNGYNHIVDGDWRLDMLSSPVRTVGISFDPADAVQPGQPGYTAPANPPYWGTEYQAVRMENKCSLDNHDMLTMKPGDKFTCPTSIRMPPTSRSTYYRLDMSGSFTFLNEPETQDAQVACNSADSAGCKDWFIDPVPIVNSDGSTSPGNARARLNLVGTHGGMTDEGDFYLTFHIHVTRP